MDAGTTPGDLPDSGFEPRSLALQVDDPTGKPLRQVTTDKFKATNHEHAIPCATGPASSPAFVVRCLCDSEQICFFYGPLLPHLYTEDSDTSDRVVEDKHTTRRGLSRCPETGIHCKCTFN